MSVRKCTMMSVYSTVYRTLCTIHEYPRCHRGRSSRHRTSHSQLAGHKTISVYLRWTLHTGKHAGHNGGKIFFREHVGNIDIQLLSFVTTAL